MKKIMNFDNFQYKRDKNISSQEYDLLMEKLKNEFIDDLTNNEKYKVFFDKCDPDTIPGFILGYVEAKIHLITCYTVIIDVEKTSNHLFYRDEALERLNWIKQKKLWDMQLQWRADRIEIDEVEICNDFHFWGENIESCPFLSSITDKEVEFLKEFLRLEDTDDFLGYEIENWQDYDEFMEKDEYGLYSHSPEFYQYLDDHLFTSYLLNFPNIRGEKEEFYTNLKHEKNREGAKEKKLKAQELAKLSEPVFLPLHFDEAIALEYAQLFEKDPHYIELFKLWQKSIIKIRERDYDKEEFIGYDIDTLKEAEVPVYMPADADWANAVRRCVKKYENEMIIEQLDSVYEEYKMFADIKITSGKSLKKIMEEKSKHWLRITYEQLILDGRELNGEPRDYNF